MDVGAIGKDKGGKKGEGKKGDGKKGDGKKVDGKGGKNNGAGKGKGQAPEIWWQLQLLQEVRAHGKRLSQEKGGRRTEAEERGCCWPVLCAVDLVNGKCWCCGSD